MVTSFASLSDLSMPDWNSQERDDFKACAHYYPPMDCVIYLRENLAYRADRVDEYLTLLWHPYETRAIGVKIKGFAKLFKTLQTVSRATGRDLPETAFHPLMKAIEAALTVQAGSFVTDHVEQERLAEQQRLTERYAKAFEVVGDITFDPSQLKKFAGKSMSHCGSSA